MHPSLSLAERVLAHLSPAERDELLECLVLALCNNVDQMQSLFTNYLVEHEFQHLLVRLERPEPD